MTDEQLKDALGNAHVALANALDGITQMERALQLTAGSPCFYPLRKLYSVNSDMLGAVNRIMAERDEALRKLQAIDAH